MDDEMSEDKVSRTSSRREVKLPEEGNGVTAPHHGLATYRRMLRSLADVTFTVILDHEGEVCSVEGLSETGALSPEALYQKLCRDHADACRSAVRGREPVAFDLMHEVQGAQQVWALTLVPSDASREETPVLLGAARDVTASQQNQASLRETATIQQRLVELLPDAIIITGSDDRLLYANTAAVEMVGAASEEELIGTSLWRFIHPESRARVRERKRRLHRGEFVDFSEHKLVRFDGEVLSIETASVPIVYQGRRAALVAARDLTGRKSMAEALARTLDLFDTAFHLGPAALVVVRLRDGVILEASERMGQLTGYTADELVGRDLRTLDLWVDPDVRDRLVGQALEEEAVWDAEFEIRRKDGTVRTVLGSAQRVNVRGRACLLASAIDITERREAASAERESRALLHKIFHASPTAIAILRIRDGCFVDVNEAMTHLVEYDVDTLLGCAPDELQLWGGDRKQYAALVAALRKHDAVHDREITLRTASGKRVTTLSSFQRIQVGGEACILAVMTDITARKEAEEALRRAKEQAEEIAQFRSALLSNMTHEIRTPLTVILGFTSMLHQGIQEEYKRFVHLIERSGRRLLLTLDSLLELAQLEAGTLDVEAEVYNVFDVVHGTAESLAPLAKEKGLAFDIDLPEVQAYARFDYDLFSHALTHLIDNAIKFTEEGGVTMSAEVTDEAVCVHVRDTGVGISKQFQARLFDAFAQESEGIDRTHQGSGLGLTVAKRLVEQVGGTIRHASEKGKGSVFTIELPRVKRQPVGVVET